MLDKVVGFQVTATWAGVTREETYIPSAHSDGRAPLDVGREETHFVGRFVVDYSPLTKAEMDVSEEDSLALIAASELLFASDEL